MFVGFMAIAIGIGSCQKYEDGPFFSLLTKKQRLTGDWEVTEWNESDTDYINEGIEIEMEFENDGDFTFKLSNGLQNYNSWGYTLTGDWEFSGDKEEIEIEFDSDNDAYTWAEWEIEITRLTNKELQGEITYSDGGSGTSAAVEFEAEKD